MLKHKIRVKFKHTLKFLRYLFAEVLYLHKGSLHSCIVCRSQYKSLLISMTRKLVNALNNFDVIPNG